MTNRTLPIYSIANFNYLGKETDFYANTIRNQLKHDKFILLPNKHDFFCAVLCSKGSGTHKVDFIKYDVKPGYIFMISPGQVHDFVLSDDADGYFIFHTKSFFNLYTASQKIQDYPFFCSIHNSPLIKLNKEWLQKTEDLFIEILEEYRNNYLMKFQRIHVLIEQLYIDLSRLYLPQAQINEQDHNYLTKLHKLEDLIDANYKKIKSPSEYANLMFMSEKHLNRICKECLNKTTSNIIIDRIMLEAKRLLAFANLSVSEVAEQLGYMDNSYFSRLFKKKCGKTPAEFASFIDKVS